jgi:hypothetical protein
MENKCAFSQGSIEIPFRNREGFDFDFDVVSSLPLRKHDPKKKGDCLLELSSNSARINGSCEIAGKCGLCRQEIKGILYLAE